MKKRALPLNRRAAMKSPPWATRGHGESHAAHTGAGGGGELVIRVPHPLVLGVIARSVLLTTVVLGFPCLRSMLLQAAIGLILPSPPHRWAEDPFFLPMLLRDLRREGLLIAGERSPAVFLGNPGARITLVKQNRMFPVMTEIGRMAIPDHSVDFVLNADSFCDASFVFMDRILRIGGVAIIRMSLDPSRIFHLPANYKIVYVRKFGSTIIGVKKMTHAIARVDANAGESEDIHIGRKLLAVRKPNKKLPKNQIGRKLPARLNSNVLTELQDAVLQPPLDLKSLAMFQKKIKHLADFLGSSLIQYPRRVFIDIGLPGRMASEEWFEKQYLKMNSKFEVIRLDVVGKVNNAVEARKIAEWLLNNVSQDEIVVTKAEDLLMKKAAVKLVDELFLECSSQTRRGGSRKAYRECLALCRRLQDEWAALHQWFEG